MAKKTVGKDISREINKELKQESCKDKNWHKHCCHGGLYGLGFLGAAIYYISTATGFWNGVLGFLKAIVWPVFLVLEVLKFIHA